MKVVASFVGVAMAATFLSSGVAMADSHLDRAVAARKAVMQLRVYNIGQLAAMAQGKMEFNADVAAAAAANLQNMADYNIMGLFPQGSSTAELGDKTTALPKIWANFPAIADKSKNLSAAVEKLVANVGTLEGLQGSIGAVGKACGSCHTDFRKKKN